MSNTDSQMRLLQCTAQIVSAHVAHNALESGAMLALIQTVHSTLSAIVSGVPDGGSPASEGKPVPAVPIKKSIHQDYLISLEDGAKVKMLKRYLATRFGLTPDEYRAKWGLPSDYPMVAPAYSERRSTLARESGLGQKPKTSPARAAPADDAEAPPDAEASAGHDDPAPDAAPAAPARKGRPPKAASKAAAVAAPASITESSDAPSSPADEPDEPPQRSVSHTAASVFANFGSSSDEGEGAEGEEPAAEAVLGGKVFQTPKRKRFAQQSARQMPRAKSPLS